MRLRAEEGRLMVVGAILLGLLSGIFALDLSERREVAKAGFARQLNRSLVAELRLTDLALGSGAAYCRHPTQADGFAAWSDHPGAPERFPAGSMVPAELARGAGFGTRRGAR